MRLRAHELPPWSSVYLVEDTEDGPRREHVAEVCGRYGGGQQLLDVRNGDLCDWIDIDDARRIEVSEIGMEAASSPLGDPPEPPEPDEDCSDRAADDYERDMDARAARQGY